VFTALFKAIGQLGDPTIRRIVLWSAVLAIGVLIILAVVVWLAVAYFEIASLPWLDRLIEFGTGLALIILCWLLFPAAVTVTIGAYLESVAGAVEASHYPGLPKPRQQNLGESVLSGFKFAAVALLLNVAALPIYLAGLFFPPLYFVVFYGLNGYLLGREYFETVALRRLDAAQTRELRRRHKRRVFAAGAIITFLLTIPFVNLIAPVIATAFMVHLFEELRRARQG
jgi:CysZ protein